MHPDPARHYRRGLGFYERDFVPPEDGFAGRTWLEFEAVAQRAALALGEATADTLQPAMRSDPE